jgi:hypothetical protein
MSAPSPTVIVSRQVLPGREAEFERWATRLLAASQRFPGHLGSELQPPGREHPEDWVVVYRFASHNQLTDWLTSEVRRELMTDSEALLRGPAREQILVEPTPDESVTAVITQRIAPGREDEFSRLHAEVASRMATFPGFVRSDLIAPVPGVQDDHVVLLAFRSRADLDTWLGSEVRAAWLERMTPLIVGERTINVVGGFAGWFRIGDGPEPRRWKQAGAVLAALFPVSLAIALIRRQVAPDLGLVWSVLVSNVLGVAALTWLLMPTITRRLADWLRR